ncbi:MAG TPA: hypothetical protein VGC97_23885 [Pyrinomonadaceae bacterium]|jgi:hypothetical protein
MKSSLIILAIACYMALALTLLDFNVAENAQAQTGAGDLVVHEWGTFTSIAGKGGVAVDWRPLSGASDLPKFVYTSANEDGLRGNYGAANGKGRVAKVRMETPVIYFYTPKAMEVDVKVAFPKGSITEWYPQAGLVNNGSVSGIDWGKMKLLPDEKPDYLREVAYSHYYPARETDAVPVQVCNADKTRIEKEKFLFYRGVGDFELPLMVKLNGEKVVLGTTQQRYGSKSNPGRNLTNLIVFENRGGKIGYELVPSLSGETTIERPSLSKNLTQVFDELEKNLVGQGLYEKEAKAMIETWKDSWFEEGLRVFYILPRMTTDEILPLTVQPRPSQTVRVLVGRAEVITPEMERDVRKQVSLLRSGTAKTREEAQENLKKYGRFYEPILKSILESETNAKVRRQIQKLIELS